jgi:hypothetical protein
MLGTFIFNFIHRQSVDSTKIKQNILKMTKISNATKKSTYNAKKKKTQRTTTGYTSNIIIAACHIHFWRHQKVRYKYNYDLTSKSSLKTAVFAEKSIQTQFLY